MKFELDDTAIEKISAVLSGYPFIAAAWLFGSVARGQNDPMSDLDIAVLYSDTPPETGWGFETRLCVELEAAIRGIEVDAVDIKKSRLLLQHNVLRTGRLIYEHDKSYRVRFVTKVIRDFCDFEPTLRLIEKYHYQGRLRRLGKI